MRALVALLLAILLAFTACGLGWGESSKVVLPEPWPDSDLFGDWPDAEADAGSEAQLLRAEPACCAGCYAHGATGCLLARASPEQCYCDFRGHHGRLIVGEE